MKRSYLKKTKKKIKKYVGLLAIALSFRYGRSAINLPENDSPVGVIESEFKNEFNFSNSGNSNTEGTHIRVKTGSGIIFSTPSLRGGDLPESNSPRPISEKSGPYARGVQKARTNGQKTTGSKSTILVEGLTPQQVYSKYHSAQQPLSCRPKVSLSSTPFNNDQGQPPPEDSQSGHISQFRGGPSPFTEFDYTNPNHTRENVDFSNQSRLSHSYDGHARECFNIMGNRNKQTLGRFENEVRTYIESPETERIFGSYRYEFPAYHYKKPDQDLIVTVNAITNEYVSCRNATNFQLEKFEIDGNLGYDSRPSMQLRLRTPPTS